MIKVLACVVIALAVSSCASRGGGRAVVGEGPTTAWAGSPQLPQSILYDTPQGPQTYVLPTTENSCAPEPQRFISIIGEVTYRVKDCVKDEWDYYPDSQRVRVQALVNQCRAKCGGR
jgi:hypothetical protein